MMVVDGIRQMLSISPENVNNGRASFRIFGFHVYTMFLWRPRGTSQRNQDTGFPQIPFSSFHVVIWTLIFIRKSNIHRKQAGYVSTG
jgi:hypothetical protein